MKSKEYIISSIFIILSLFILSNQKAFGAISITVTGTWSELIDGMDLQGPPGSDLNNTYESSTTAIDIGITGAGSRPWRVNVRKVDILWPTSFTLYVRRTSDGSGSGSISGGNEYKEVIGVDNLFFSGNENRQGIKVQLKLSGVSAQIPLGNYLTTIIYTITDD